jgi:hypothetical protein
MTEDNKETAHDIFNKELTRQLAPTDDTRITEEAGEDIDLMSEPGQRPLRGDTF